MLSGLTGLLVVLGLGVLAPAAAAGTAPGDEPAWIRPAHLVPGLGAMDVRLSPFADEGSGTPADEQPLLEITADYGAVGEYQQLPAGSYAVSLRPAGTPVSEEPLLTLTVDLEAGRAYTAAGLGTTDDPRLELLDDDLTPPGDGSASVRLLPASLAAPAVDVRAEGGPVLAEGAPLGQATDYQRAPAGSWTVSASGGAATGSTQLDLASGSVYTLLVLDGEGGGLVVEPVVDAVGIGTMPVGGAATGFGGLAEQGTDDVGVRTLALAGPLLLLALGVVTVTVGLVGRARRTPATERPQRT